MSSNQILKDARYVRTNVPVLYQYHSIEGAKALLDKQTIQVKNPEGFNDPYDCDLGLLKFEKASKFKEDLLNRTKAKNSPEFIKTINELNDEEINQTFSKKVFPKYSKTIGVSCFSEIHDNMLMWSHYTYSHAGVCFGFDLMKLYYSLKESAKSQISMIKVNYTDTFEPTDYFNDRDLAIYNWIRTKSKNWEYEKEIRLLYINLNFDMTFNQYFHFDLSAIKEIYLGSKIEESNQEYILNFCSKYLKGIKIRKMQKQKNTFRLESKII